MSEPLTAYIVSSNIGASFRCGLNSVVLDCGTALYLVSEVEARLATMTQARDRMMAIEDTLRVRYPKLNVLSSTHLGFIEHATTILIDELVASQARCAELEAVLTSLHDNQNGCPLLKYEADWSKAMVDAERLLGYTITPPKEEL